MDIRQATYSVPFVQVQVLSVCHTMQILKSSYDYYYYYFLLLCLLKPHNTMEDTNLSVQKPASTKFNVSEDSGRKICIIGCRTSHVVGKSSWCCLDCGWARLKNVVGHQY